jgi:hypothetical protein
MGGLFKKPDNRAAEQQLEMQRQENARVREEAQQERADILEAKTARRRAMQRGGSRMLLSAARVAPEMGIQTFGATEQERTA